MNNKTTISLNALNQILMQFGQNIGLGSFALDENYSASLIFDDRFLVELQALDRESDNIHNLYFVASLCDNTLNKNDKEAAFFYLKLLQSNLSGKIMHGVNFAIDMEHNEVLLLRPLAAYQLNLENIEKEMENFVNVLEQWAACLNNGVLDWNTAQKKTDASGASAHNKATTPQAAGFRV